MKALPKWLHYPLILGAICAASGGFLAYVYSVTKEGIESSRKVEAMKAIAAVAFNRTLEAATLVEKEGKKLAELLDEEETLLGYVEEVEGEGGDECYAVLRPDMSPVGYGAVTPGPGSYNSMNPVKILTVLDPKMERLIGARVVESAETPGLGEKAKEVPPSYSIFGRLSGAPLRQLVVTKEGRCFAGEVTVNDDGSVVVRTADGKEHTFKKGQFWREPRAPLFMEQFSGLSVEEARLKSDGGKVDAITGATVTSRAVTKAVSDAVARLRAARIP